MFIHQRTIKEEVDFEGIGLHTGTYSKVNLKPAKVGTGIIFILKIDNKKIHINASYKNVVETNRGTTIGSEGYKIYTVEHLLSAIYAHGVDNLYIEIDNIEPPILDGSSIGFYNGILKVGVKKYSAERKRIKIKKPIYFLDSKNDVEMSILPYDGFKVTFNAVFEYGEDKEQSFVLDDIKNYSKDIAPARTFCSFNELDYLKSNNLIKGASLDSGIVFMNDNISLDRINNINDMFDMAVNHKEHYKTLNNVKLRYQDEQVRHKVLDLIGDFSLINGQIIGHIISNKSGHYTNIEFLKKICEESDSSKKYNFNKDQIKKVIPHRNPFLLIDEIIDIVPGEKVLASKEFTEKDYFLEGHFPGNPIVPGVIIIECMAQASCFLSLNLVENRESKMMLLTSIKSSRFIRKVSINETLLLEVNLVKFKLNTALFSGIAKIKNEVVAQAEFLATVVEKND